MEPKLKEILEGVDFVSTTADVWKSCNKGFFGMTVHLIDPSTLKHFKAHKCTSLWNKASQSTEVSDHVEETLKRKLTVPTSTRWNSYYDAVSRITENTFDEINPLCTKLEPRCIHDKKFTFLTEYCKVLDRFCLSLYHHLQQLHPH